MNPLDGYSFLSLILFYIDFSPSGFTYTHEQFSLIARQVHPAISSEMENCNNCIFWHNSQVKPGGNCFPPSELLKMMHFTKCVLLSICLWRSLEAVRSRWWYKQHYGPPLNYQLWVTPAICWYKTYQIIPHSPHPGLLLLLLLFGNSF